MTFGLEEIQSAYREGEAIGATHMIVSHDSVDFDQMVTYIMPGESVWPTWYASAAYRQGFDAPDECYRFDLGWDAQSIEPRANHWEDVS